MRLIDVDKLVNDIAEHITVKAVSRVIAIIQGQPIVDAEPVRHGRWMVDPGDRNTGYGGEIVCSECGTGGFSDFWDYCPKCGADMRGEQE